MTEPHSKHWRRELDSNGVCRLRLDKSESRVNTLSREVVAELDRELDFLLTDPPAGLIFESAKPSGFILGADVSEFKQLETAEQATSLAARGQRVLDKIAAFPAPTVAAIDGHALGGGLELGLACAYRVAVEGYERTLGLPEVQLGIHPGFGGTVRSVELLGAPAALDLMLTGRSVTPNQALSLGLVDRVVARDELDATCVALCRRHPRPRRAPWHLRLAGLAPFRPLLARSLRRRLSRKASPEHYPAPYAIIDLWLRHGGRGSAAYQAEALSIGRLLVGRTCRNLVRVFFLRERLRNLAPKERAISRVHVIGAGVMGGDIAGWCALSGLTVSLQDREQKFIDPAIERARTLFDRRLKAPGAAERARQRLVSDLAGEHAANAEILIEAIVENLDAKRSLFRELEPRVAEDAILATNTSSIELEEIATALTRRERFLGLHFFNPVARLLLVEVVRARDTSEEAMRCALSFVVQIGKLPLPCRSAPGFLVNRILGPYMLEALRALEEGHPAETIDRAAEDFGMPTGPVELADRVGLDVAQHVTRILSEKLGVSIPAALDAKVEAGHLGAKSGRGFYTYKGHRPVKRHDYPRPDAELQDRLILSLLNEAVACHDAAIVEDYDLLDAGAVFGIGFAPFTGGPINYARERGVGSVVARLQELAARHGPRFTPHPGWSKLAET